MPDDLLKATDARPTWSNASTSYEVVVLVLQRIFCQHPAYKPNCTCTNCCSSWTDVGLVMMLVHGVVQAGDAILAGCAYTGVAEEVPAEHMLVVQKLAGHRQTVLEPQAEKWGAVRKLVALVKLWGDHMLAVQQTPVLIQAFHGVLERKPVVHAQGLVAE
eukprot:CAMPEP_0172719620 /NCGR_PEP_ID=MMETSP1074-20121228/75609_1 /TAXON_ID=2916 /ORGANISM="Ceratium fusus, Strain PA161109" /LENGTH=159 /DNA_ID=CAMNT_0013544989 /DNA_START=285 /DNA_END=766 /DNA_ORIENTATION=-